MLMLMTFLRASTIKIIPRIAATDITTVFVPIAMIYFAASVIAIKMLNFQNV